MVNAFSHSSSSTPFDVSILLPDEFSNEMKEWTRFVMIHQTRCKQGNQSLEQILEIIDKINGMEKTD